MTTATMLNPLKTKVAEAKPTVENVMEIFEKGAEAVAIIAADISPIFSIAAPILQLVMDGVEDAEVTYMKTQFQKVRDRLEVISEEVERINLKIQKSTIDIAFFSVEENITNQFRKYMEVLSASKNNLEFKKKNFSGHFKATGGDKNLHTLYDGVMGNGAFGKSLLETVMVYEEKSLRPMVEFCARLKNLFCIGLITLLGYTALTDANEENLLTLWRKNMMDVQTKIVAVLDDCKNSFLELAEKDCMRLVRDQSGLTNQQLADAIIEKLKKKFYWVSWSVRVFSSPTSYLPFVKDQYHSPTGKSRFTVPSSSNEKLNVVVSYSASAEPVNKDAIKLKIKALEGGKVWKVEKVAEMLFEELQRACVVHTVKSLNDLACCWSFSDDCHYWEEHKKFCICIHSV